MSLNKWYDKGITADQYITTLENHEEAFSHINHKLDLSNFEVDDAFFQTVKNKQLRVIAIAEPWCGHCMLNIPILLHLAEKTDMTVRILARDENLELMDQYLTNGKSRSIPIFIFIDKDGNEVTKWGPVANKIKEFIDKYKETLPSKEADDYDEKFGELIKFTSKSFRDNEEFWQASFEGMKQALSK